MKRGEMGAGTLILLIALIFISAVAATVLIQTTNTAQQKALNVGGQATRTIATRMDIVHAAATDGTTIIENLTLTTRLGPGASATELDTLLVTLDTRNTTTLYTYSGSNAYTVNATNQTGAFGIMYLEQGPNYHAGVLSRGDLITVTIRAPRALVKDEEFRLKLVPAASMPTVLTMSLPHTIYTPRVHLYP